MLGMVGGGDQGGLRYFYNKKSIFEETFICCLIHLLLTFLLLVWITWRCKRDVPWFWGFESQTILLAPASNDWKRICRLYLGGKFWCWEYRNTPFLATFSAFQWFDADSCGCSHPVCKIKKNTGRHAFCRLVFFPCICAYLVWLDNKLSAKTHLFA